MESRVIGKHWIESEELQRMTIVSLIDHALWCQKLATESLNRDPYRDESPDEPRSKWGEYCNQVQWCLMELNSRGVYASDPYRDDKGVYTYTE